jgi:Protein of unknown function (DUF2933)
MELRTCKRDAVAASAVWWIQRRVPVEFLFGLLPLAVFLICPLAMIFMMRGMHGGHGGHNAHNEPDPAIARKLAAMELEIARLRGELDAADGRAVVGEPGAGRE